MSVVEYLNTILGYVVPIISEASKSQLGLISLIALIVGAIVLLFYTVPRQLTPS